LEVSSEPDPESESSESESEPEPDPSSDSLSDFLEEDALPEDALPVDALDDDAFDDSSSSLPEESSSVSGKPLDSPSEETSSSSLSWLTRDKEALLFPKTVDDSSVLASDVLSLALSLVWLLSLALPLV
jgi:hypothetical protein